MKYWNMLLVAVCVVALSSSFASEASKKPRGIISFLKVGDSVSLIRERTGCSIFIPKGGVAASKVTEVGDDYFVVHVKDDSVELNADVIVPVSSLRWIERPR
jgi:hypothetical protein